MLRSLEHSIHRLPFDPSEQVLPTHGVVSQYRFQSAALEWLA